MIVLGIDPSLRGTGWGVIESHASGMRGLGFGVIKQSIRVSPSGCLVRIREELIGVIDSFHPEVAAIEGAIFAQNIRTAIVMGQARGAALIAVEEAGLTIFEYAPRRVKQSVVGTGTAAKNQVSFMIRALLSLKETPEPDAADALAIAMTHVNSQRSCFNELRMGKEIKRKSLER
jgi:crossover junction endodeoxyribonuclease RuvC